MLERKSVSDTAIALYLEEGHYNPFPSGHKITQMNTFSNNCFSHSSGYSTVVLLCFVITQAYAAVFLWAFREKWGKSLAKGKTNETLSQKRRPIVVLDGCIKDIGQAYRSWP